MTYMYQNQQLLNDPIPIKVGNQWPDSLTERVVYYMYRQSSMHTNVYLQVNKNV